MSGADGERACEGRRRFVKRCVMGGSGAALAALAARDFLGPGGRGRRGELRVGFRNDAPRELGAWARPALWWERHEDLTRCTLCPHECQLGENDRGFCRVRVVRGGELHSLVFGNPCAIHLDPIEKKPLYHFLPGTAILSLATAGCNLRCMNCQNWEISQVKPEEVRHEDLPPDGLVRAASARAIPSIAYTYSEPVVFYEYVRETSARARDAGIRNVLVTAGYINERPLRELCGFIDAVNLDIKAFDDGVYRRLTGGCLAPVLRCAEVLREEGVWLEITRLLVPEYADDLEDVRKLCQWIARSLGPDIPLHLSRFHPAHRLQRLPPTPPATMERASEIARGEGLRFVYVGNLPGGPGHETRCPACGRVVVAREGFEVVKLEVRAGRCACGAPVPGVWT